MKKCNFCAKEIRDDAIKCNHCGSDLTPVDTLSSKQEPAYDVMPLVFWFLSNIFFMMFQLRGNIPTTIGFAIGYFISVSIPSLIISGFACLIFKRIRNWRAFLFGATIINILLAVLSFTVRQYMDKL